MQWTTRLGALILLGFSAFFFVKRSWLMGALFLGAWFVVEMLMFRQRRARPPK
ncbi:hypothetical protein [Usitatibacter palustris]|uniref:Uncharacterized protein n=1 Tax=Usitatibacter palustris TaxID=2732487 RepID=A0A6M4H285_9PROT|nr:hypothetical protein [Usitatibacter palustris]QJR13580.1 hypothetical protein DSM104440_00364 [Usitatibacter palustris]